MEKQQIQANAEAVIQRYREQVGILSHQLLLNEVVREEYAEEILRLRNENAELQTKLESGFASPEDSAVVESE